MSYRKPFDFAYNRRQLTPFYQSRAPVDILGGFQNFLIRTTNYVINTATPQVITSATQALDVYVQRFNESVAKAISNFNFTNFNTPKSSKLDIVSRRIR
jgi:hypothetical protein